jgi:lipopolysaccharide transport system permease protein
MTQSITEIHAHSRESLRHLLQDLWAYRDLFITFVERDLKVRYKQTFLGVTWVLLYPLLFSGIFAIIFGHVAKMPKNDPRIPYWIFYFAALVPWQCFANGLSQAASSLEGNSGLISKIYFPRIIVPASVLLGTVVDFAIGWIVFNVAAAYFGLWTWKFILFTPILLLLQLLTALGAGLILSVLNAQYRDVRYVVPFLIQLAMFLTPVIYPVSRLPEWLMWGVWINPMAGIIETYRALLSGDYIPYEILALNGCVTVGLFMSGIWIFQRRTQRIIDIL